MMFLQDDICLLNQRYDVSGNKSFLFTLHIYLLHLELYYMILYGSIWPIWMLSLSCRVPHWFGQGSTFSDQSLYIYIYESRAETHERFYMIEVHRHRFEMPARKVPFEKCTRWRKVCGRSAKDQIGDSIYSFFFTISSERFAKGARKMRERRIHSSHVLPKWNAFSHAWCWSKGKEATYHNDILVVSIHSCKQQPIYCIVCSSLFDFIYLIPDTNSWFWKCNPYGTAKGGERFAKGGFLGTLI